MEQLIEQLQQNLKAQGLKPETCFEGMQWAKPLTYWDYIQTDALLNLQVQRTTLPDEMVFVMYHQVNELLFKMALWELEQLCHNPQPTTAFFTEKLDRVSRYFDILTQSFTIMGEGMQVEQYQKFRHTLAPASGFQSAQYRLIEFASTDLINLIDYRFRADIDRNTPYSHAFEHLYWQAAGKDYTTGEKSYLIRAFEERYKEEFLRFMETYNTINVWQKFKQLPETDQLNPELIQAMRHYDHTVNITWVMGHYNAAKKYLGNAEATGGSSWQKYMLPQYQRRIFYPALWTEDELKHWGEPA
jgi:tryptophan 2,3-dioxygenase